MMKNALLFASSDDKTSSVIVLTRFGMSELILGISVEHR